MLTALAGGVGAARLLRGLVDVVPPETVVAVVNTADDVIVHGLHVSPDLDTVTYTLADAVDPERGWGLGGETWATMEALDRYGRGSPAGSRGGQTWFRLGDRDLATHLYRTQRLAEGATLTTVLAASAAGAEAALPRLGPAGRSSPPPAGDPVSGRRGAPSPRGATG